MNAHGEIPALAAERNGTVRRILALEGVAHAALLDGKKPQAFKQLQDEIQTLRARVRLLDQQIKQSDA